MWEITSVIPGKSLSKEEVVKFQPILNIKIIQLFYSVEMEENNFIARYDITSIFVILLLERIAILFIK